jgi:hypothetical protein
MPAILPFNNKVSPVANPIKTPPIKERMGVNSVQFMRILRHGRTLGESTALSIEAR